MVGARSGAPGIVVLNGTVVHCTEKGRRKELENLKELTGPSNAKVCLSYP